MGYELDRLMRQYGVGSPTISYGGTAIPAAVAALPTGATAEQQTAHTAAQSAYDAQKAAYDADRAAFDAYRQQYLDRVSGTPQYAQAQYDTGNRPMSDAMRWVTSRNVNATTGEGMGVPQYQQNIRNWAAQHPNATNADVAQQQRDWGISNQDIYGATGNYWGNTLKAPSYQNYAAPVVAAPVTTTTQTPLSTNDQYTGGGGGGGGGDGGGYAQGGSVHSMARKYQLGGDAMTGGEPQGAADLPTPAVTADPTAAPVPAPEPKPVVRPAPTTTPMSPAANDLMAMMQRYTGPSQYAPELAAARQRMTAESATFDKMIQDAMKTQNSAPDKAEMYFRLAAAFGAPTRTGHFGETLAGVGKELGEYAKDVRTARKADQQLRTQLGIEAQKLKTQSAKEELHSLQALAGEESKDKRAVVMEYLKSGRPQSEAGKAAVDAGLTQGTPEFSQFVNKYVDDKIRSGNLLKEAMVAIAGGQLQVAQSREARAAESSAKLSPQEVKLKSEAETTLGGLDDSMTSLKRAYALNPNTFDGTLAATAQRKVLEQTDPQDVRVLATREQANLLSKGAIDKLRASFGGNPTEGERAALLSLEGLDSKSKEERATIMKNTYKLLQARRAREQKRLNDINAGLYRETTPAPSEGIE